MADRYVDPRFAHRMRELREARGLSYRALAARTFVGKSYLQELTSGIKSPSVQIARRIDEALEAGGELVGYVVAAPVDGRRSMSHTGPMLRRNVLLALTGLGVGHLV